LAQRLRTAGRPFLSAMATVRSLPIVAKDCAGAGGAAAPPVSVAVAVQAKRPAASDDAAQGRTTGERRKMQRLAATTPIAPPIGENPPCQKAKIRAGASAKLSICRRTCIARAIAIPASRTVIDQEPRRRSTRADRTDAAIMNTR